MSKPNSDWDPAEPQTVEDRVAQLNEVRGRCPVAYTDRIGGAWAVMTYDDLQAVALDTERFSNGGTPRYGRGLPPLEVDPPEHTQFRRLLQGFFLPKRIAQLEPKLRAAANGLLDTLLSGEGPVDLAAGFAYPLPVLGLCAALDVDGADWMAIKTWSEDSLMFDSSDPEDLARAKAGHENLIEVSRGLVKDRRAAPRDPKEDIAAALLAARINDETIDDERIAGMLRLLFSAGHNSTTSALGNTLLYLAEHPDEQKRLRNDRALIAPAIEEILRFDTPVQEMPRTTTQEVELHGRALPAGSRIAMFWASGNRDETAFPDPDRCILNRAPNRHLAFGYGAHTCIGASLARLEMTVAIEALFDRTRHFSVDGVVERMPFRRMGVRRLPVKIEREGG